MIVGCAHMMEKQQEWGEGEKEREGERERERKKEKEREREGVREIDRFEKHTILKESHGKLIKFK